VTDIVIRSNDISEVNQRGVFPLGMGFIFSSAYRVYVIDNDFHGFSMVPPDPNLPAPRSIIDLALTWDGVVAGNRLYDIEMDPAQSSAFYIWSDSAGAQATHVIRDNELNGLTDVGWCWNSDASPFHDDVELTVYDNLIDGVVQQPNPGCY
jgi:hypothetical protein